MGQCDFLTPIGIVIHSVFVNIMNLELSYSVKPVYLQDLIILMNFSSSYHYVVLVSPGGSMNVSAAKQFKAETTFLSFTPDEEPESVYSYAVLLETNSGYRSVLSEVVSLAPVNG